MLETISLQAIHLACDEMRIYCSTCSPDQLDALKTRKILPITAYQCGLITKSDAERLAAFLLERNPPRASLAGFNAKASPFSFKVQHECFGKCFGILLPEACTGPTARCIECLDCEGLFSPSGFVCHSHSSVENRTCHWGFDSANWRSYLHLHESYEGHEKERIQRRFQEFKSRFVALTAASAAPAPASASAPAQSAATTTAAAAVVGHKRKSVRTKQSSFFFNLACTY